MSVSRSSIQQPLLSKRWMLFVDGENLAIRGQETAKVNSIELAHEDFHEPDVFLWFPTDKDVWETLLLAHCPFQLKRMPERTHYYTSIKGDDLKIKSLKNKVWRCHFDPHVFKKEKDGRSKQVDISLTTDLLSNAYRDRYDVAVVISGDGDFIPVLSEVRRLGKQVILMALSSGRSPKLAWSSDYFKCLNELFLRAWRASKGVKGKALRESPITT